MKRRQEETAVNKQTECIEEFLRRAEADETVYITDVRNAFNRVGTCPFHIHADLYEGQTEVFALRLPKWEDSRQRQFIASYVRAFLYDLLSTLGAVRLVIFLDTADREVVSLAEGLREDFQIDMAMSDRSGYGKCLNVNERILRALFGGQVKFTLEIEDISKETAPAEGKRVQTGEPVFAGISSAAKSLFLLGVDVGGSDVKFAVSLCGKLVHCEEMDWAPISFANVEELTGPVMETAQRLMEQFGGGRKWDAIGLSWPDVIIRNMVVGGETTKTKGMRENRDRDYEEQLARLTAFTGVMGRLTKSGRSVVCCNDGAMAAFTDAVEMAAAGEDVSNGFFAYSLGTELGTGWVMADGSIPQIPLEVYNCIIDLGSRKACGYEAEDARSCRNVNTLLAGSLQRYTGQMGVFRLAIRNLPDREPEIFKEALDRGLFEVRDEGRLVVVPTEPVDRRKECLEFFMEKAASGESEVCRDIFRSIGEYIAVTWRENEYLLHPEARERTLFGRLVKRKECFDLIKEGAARREPSLVIKNADSGLAVTPLMKQLEEDPQFTVAQFAQAVGALHFACLGA